MTDDKRVDNGSTVLVTVRVPVDLAETLVGEDWTERVVALLRKGMNR